MGDEISGAIRLLVIEPAAHRGEYCLVHEDDSFTPHQIDHIVSRKHGGDSSPGNLALACVRCNAWKGSDIAGNGLEPGRIVPLTETATATARLLRLNLLGRVSERRTLSQSGRYPRENP